MTTMNYNNSSMSSASTQTVPESLTQGLNQNKGLDKETEKYLVSWVNDAYKTMKNARSRIELQWAINLAFYFGKHYVEPSRYGSATTGARLIIPPAPSYRTRLVLNRIRPIIRRELAKLTSQKPTVTVTPASSEDRDFFAAQAGEQIWDSLYREHNLQQVIKRAVWWTCVTGCGYIKAYWDGYKSTQTVNSETGQLQEGQGDCCFIPVTPFHVMVPDLREEDLELQPYLIHVQTRPADWIRMHFPHLINITPDTAEANDILEDSFINLVTDKDVSKDKAVVMKECWIKPNELPQFPSGGVITVIGDRIGQYIEGWPFIHGKFPFTKIDHIPSGKFYADSVITDLIPPQKEYNRTRSQIVEAKNRMAKPGFFYARGSLDPTKITTEAGQYVPYTPGFEPPIPIPLTPLPNYVLQEVERIQTDINDISGQHEVTKGQTPPGVTAATAISFLQEQDESMLSHTYDSVESSIEKIAFMALGMVHQFWDEARIVKIVGTDGSFDAKAFMGSQIDKNADIKVEAGSALPTSKAARQAFLMDLMKMGFIDPNEGLELMDVGGINKLTERIRIDSRQAQRENLRMAAVTEEDFIQYQQLQQQQAQIDPATGQPTNPEFIDPETGGPITPPPIIPVNTWDNHKIHVAKHNDFRKSQAFEALSDMNKQLFEAHVQDHLAAIAFENQYVVPQLQGPGEGEEGNPELGPGQESTEPSTLEQPGLMGE